MIVKVAVNPNIVQIFDQQGRLIKTDEAKASIMLAAQLNKNRFKSLGLVDDVDAERGEIGYFAAKWLNGKVTLVKPVKGYNF